MKRKRGISHWDRMKVDPLPVPKVIELPLGGERVVRLSRFDTFIRLLSGHVMHGDAVSVGGSICIPLDDVPDLLAALRMLHRQRR